MNIGILFITCLALLGYYALGYFSGKKMMMKGEWDAFLGLCNTILIGSAIITALYCLWEIVSFSIQTH